MRLLRALAHLALALALIAGGFSSARAAPFGLAGMPEHRSAMDHHASGDHEAHAGHDHAPPASQHPTHQQDACQTACCFVPSQLPPRAPGASAVGPFCAVRYLATAQPASGRADAPEPGIPKLVA